MTKQVNINLMKRQRHSKDIGIGGMAARWYDNSTRKHRLAEMKGYAREVARHIQDGCSALEVAPGPGYLAIELAKLGEFKIIGPDISKDFVEIAKRNAKEAGVEVEFRQGSVADIPFPNNTFDFIICTAAFKNFKEPLKALSQMYRVLKPRGTALIVDMNRHASNQQIEDYTKNIGTNGMDKLFMKLVFKYFLRNGAYTKDEFVDLISKTSFKEYHIKEEEIGFYIYLRK
ncbi:MAG TPA: class I SAM-dependent methyltransferase [Nitrososphaera sp.]|jgi:ubiquinone/menaquinone biosynthesis C-methylase UbiE|nr:class I SAM-dependent methyltransferase [Nitrososphaera sp.]